MKDQVHIWHPNLGQGCHYWQQGLVGEIGTKRQIAALSEAPSKWLSVEIIFGDDGWTKKGLTKCPANGFVGSLFPDGISIF